DRDPVARDNGVVEQRTHEWSLEAGERHRPRRAREHRRPLRTGPVVAVVTVDAADFLAPEAEQETVVIRELEWQIVVEHVADRNAAGERRSERAGIGVGR